LERDSRVRVTGYVEDAQDVLKTMSVVLCPFTGTYGFRSRIVEVMALGIPMVVSPDAIYGMDMDIGRGLFVEKTDQKMAQTCIKLIQDQDFARQQSNLARTQVAATFSFEATYGMFAPNLYKFLKRRNNKTQTKGILEAITY
jgi:glycosyltransferase involved in cell wall biosynthesis